MSVIEYPFKKRLSNGITVVGEQLNQVESITLGVWVKVGSVYESNLQSGITHFLEHMLFKGTKSRSAYEIARSMEAVGGKLNAFTGHEYTCYHARCLSEHMPLAMSILSDMVLYPTLPKKEIEKEKYVVMEEMKMYRDSPEEYIFEEFIQNLYKNHPLGQLIIGNEKTLMSFDQDMLHDFMKSHYTSNKIIISVAGNIQAQHVIEEVEKCFIDLPISSNDVDYEPFCTYQPFKKNIERAIEQVHLIIGKPGLTYYDPNRYTLSVIDTLLGSGMSCRLHQNIREKYGYCYTIQSFSSQFRHTGLYGIYAGTDNAHLKNVEQLIYNELQKLCDEKLNEDQVEKLKIQLKGGLLLSMESVTKRMYRIAKNEICYNKFIPINEIVEAIEAIDSNKINNFCETFFDPSTFSVITLTPKNES